MSNHPAWRPQQQPASGGWASPTATPPRRRTPGWFPAVVAVGAAALVGIVVVSITLAVGGGRGGEHRATGGSPTPTRSTPASASPSPSPSRYSTLPDACAIGASKPKQVAGAETDRTTDDDQNLCSWQIFRSDRTAYLQIAVNKPTGPGDQTAAAKSSFADDKKYAGESDNKYEKDPKGFSGLGDEAFTAKYSNDVVYGKSEADAKTYHLGGAWVEARAGNVTVSVKWGGATYDGIDSDGKGYTGTNYRYATTDKQARAIVRTLLGKLS